MTTLICLKKTNRWKSRALSFEIMLYTILTHVGLFFLGGFTIWRNTETAQSIVAPPIDDSMAIAADSKGPTEGLRHGGTMANRGNHGFLWFPMVSYLVSYGFLWFPMVSYVSFPKVRLI